ncbi:MerR family transcriptional regulator [Myxococcota bacterium]|nr:MerR family transcriptional regulator [Myxococcota bacterium]MBU1429167.1 MerR family transcriptional regulator [Myxococcota bacterium]MBU1896365.1 MerR family transcriptional regulator [Myxococcota bacterium]
MSRENLLKIGALARTTDKTVRALHLYEEMGLLSPSARSPGGFRLYDEANVERIRYIDRLQKLDYSLTEIRALLQSWREGETPREAMASIEDVYRARLIEVRESIAELEGLALELERSLDFLEGCHDCGQSTAPVAACRCCERPDPSGQVSLITGLASH